MTASKLLSETRLISRYFQAAAPTSAVGLLGGTSFQGSSIGRYFGFDERKGAFADSEPSVELHSPCGYKFQLQPTHGSTSSVIEAQGQPFSGRIEAETKENTSK